MIAYYIAQMSHVVRMCPYSNIQMSQVVKCVRHTNDHTNESLPIIISSLFESKPSKRFGKCHLKKSIRLPSKIIQNKNSHVDNKVNKISVMFWFVWAWLLQLNGIVQQIWVR